MCKNAKSSIVHKRSPTVKGEKRREEERCTSHLVQAQSRPRKEKLK
jgi:hypothetical protein